MTHLLASKNIYLGVLFLSFRGALTLLLHRYVLQYTLALDSDIRGIFRRK